MAAKQNIESIYRLTPAQEGILFHVIQDPGSGAYFQQFTCVLSRDIDDADFEEAWQRTLALHPGMRALFTWEGRENPLQVVRRRVELPFEVVEDADLARGGDRLESWLIADRKRGFRLDQAPLMRVTLVRDPSGAHDPRLIWSFHHIALDGWSMRVFLQQVLECYTALKNNQEPPRREALAHEEYVAWLATRDADRARSYWRRLLHGFETPTDLQLARPGIGSGSGSAEVRFSLSGEASEQVRRAAREARVTLNTMLRGAWSILLQRYGSEDDVVFGATVSGRDPALEGAESVVGMCINTVPVRAHVDDTARVRDLLLALQTQQLEGAPFEATSLVEIQHASEVPAGTPLFETILVFENHPVADDADENDATGRVEVRDPRFVERSNYPLALLVIPGDEIEFILVYDYAWFQKSAIERLVAHLRRVLDAAASDTTMSIGDIDVLTPEDRRWLESAASAHGGQEVPRAALPSVIEMFEESAKRHAQSEALRFDGRSTSYAALHDGVLAFASDLRARGVGTETRVAICLDRGVEMITAMFGVLAAGGAYVPIDPDWPEDRIRYVLRDSEAALTVTTTKHLQRLPDETSTLRIDAPQPRARDGHGLAAPVRVTDDSLAYILYTSGSTGEPKGVEITHRNLAASTQARFAFYGRADDVPSRFLLLSAFHFDSSVAGIYWSLCSGGALVLPPHEATQDLRLLADIVATENVTHTLCLPSFYEPFLEITDGDELASLRAVIVAGEACSNKLVMAHARALRHAELINEYGPTEGTVWATAYRIDLDRDSTSERTVPIGKPIGDTRLLILDRVGRPAPIGVAGEIHLGGSAIARGYAGDPEQTAERFAPVPAFGRAPERVYRTGDRGRFRDDGHVEFLGRVDDQVKIRGHRIELGAIQTRLREMEHVRDVAVLARDLAAGRARGLVAYVVAESDAVDAVSLRDALRATLPAVMIPSDFVMLDSLPRTSSGKIDRRRLPQPRSTETPAGLHVPQTDLEVKLAAIWSDVLDLDSVPTDTNFFELGGDSLLSIRIIARAHREGLRVDPVQFASNPTIRGMAAAVEPSSATRDTSASPQGPLPLSPIQDWFFGLALPEPHHWNQAELFELPGDAVAADVRTALRAVVAAHDALRLRFTKTESGWRQQVSPAGDPPFEQWDLTGIPTAERDQAFEAAASKLQSSIDLESGQPLRAAFVRHDATAAPRLLLAIHHLAVDAVSWGIIREDLNRAYDNARSGTTAPRLPRAASFAQWVRALETHARSKTVTAEIDHWSSLTSVAAPKLPFDFANGEDANRVDAEATVTAALEISTTRALLQEVPPVYGTRIHEVLVTALARAIARWTHGRGLYFEFEGHGRDPQVTGLDPARCVGWMTSVWPVALQLPETDEIGAALKSIKEQMRRVPGGGIGFGLLRSLGDESSLCEAERIPRADLLFNYLGRRETANITGDMIRSLADAPVGACRSSRGKRGYLLEVNAFVDERGALRSTWSYSTEVHRHETIETLSIDWMHELEAIVEHCAHPTSGGKTPSDFPLAGLDQSQLDRLSDLLDDD